MTIRIYITLLFSFFGFSQSWAQNTDSANVKTDTIKNIKIEGTKPTLKATSQNGQFKDSTRLALEAMPRKAVLRSLILPGLGQFKNKGWMWYAKIPAMYAGFVAFGIAIDHNQKQYKVFLNEAKYRQEFKKPKDLRYAAFDLNGIIEIKDTFRRNKILSVFGFVAVYGVNLIDAYVTAKFLRYDISEDLSFHLQPTILNQPTYTNAFASPVPALKFTLSL